MVSIDTPFEWLSPLVGAPPDHLKLLVALLSTFPLAHLFVRIPPSQKNLKHVLSIALAYFYLVTLFGMKWGFLQLLVDVLAVYAVVKSGLGVGKDGRGEGWMPWVVFWGVMGHLICNHAYRELTHIPASEMEITAMQLVLTMKLITFAWNVEDGRLSSEEVDPQLLATRLTEPQIPSLLGFMGYCFFFPGILVGPASDYASYNSLIEGTLFVRPVGTNEASRFALKENEGRLSGKSSEGVKGEERKDRDLEPLVESSLPQPHARLLIPRGRKTIAYLKLVVGLGMLGFYSTFGGKMAYERIVGEEAWWSAKGWFARWVYVMIAGFTARTKYYAIWSISEGACILTGIGYNGLQPGQPPKELWNRVQNIDIWNIETAQSFKVLFDSWNCRANVWLRDTVYKRVTKKGEKPGFYSTVMTFLTSAFWHGISPGYYLAFLTAGFCTSLGRPIRHLVRPFFLPENVPSRSPLPKRTYDIISWLIVQSLTNYFVAAFIVLGWKECMTVWSRMGWYGHVMIGITYGALKMGGEGWLKGMNARAGRGGKKVQ